MKLLVLSDLHLEFGPLEVDSGYADVVVLAGDIHLKTRGVEWAKETFPNQPVVMVLGNHEYYGEKYPNLLEKAKIAAQDSNVRVLENESIEINGVRFLGCTLWTDLRLQGDPRMAGYFCQQEMTDFKKIRVAPRYSKLSPVSMTRIHEKSLSWLRTQLQTPFSGKTVVVTHHAPSARSISEAHREELTSAAYASHLDDVVETSSASLWVHGHLHNSSDYTLSNTRVVCNPRGYLPDELNPNFETNYVVEV
ncbi:metallophosphoesterase [Spongiibacter nanhainus]|uniref:Metallophosphoesterase n=1 Tax=Spongiibacter nanhainus TaxID=2794344 RepID=A0A7T4QZ42_9GAMM|nr:metallophosphoesterase [Spongiibacter nanhainus]QQD17458.1 metallophosphoesterase [Spongiibacter nanhainus]